MAFIAHRYGPIAHAVPSMKGAMKGAVLEAIRTRLALVRTGLAISWWVVRPNHSTS